MPKALQVERGTAQTSETITLRRDGQPDLEFEGVLLLTVETEPVTNRAEQKRWKRYSLYRATGARLVVAEEGHSNVSIEVTKYSATVCRSGAEAWIAMGRIEELKKEFAALGHPAVERLGDE